MNKQDGASALQAGKAHRTLLGVALLCAVTLTAGCQTMEREQRVESPVAAIEPQSGEQVGMVAPPERPIPPEPRRKPDVDLAARPQPADREPLVARPALDPQGLVGLDFVKAENLLGPPSLLIEEPPAKIWTYNGRDCVLQLFFYPKVGGAFEVLTYQALGGEGDRQPSDGDLVRDCLTQLLVERQGRNAESS